MEETNRLDEETSSKVYNLIEHREREQYFREMLPKVAPVAADLLMAGSMEKNFIHNLAKYPTTRHEAHWALQTFLLWELLQEIKQLNASIGKCKSCEKTEKRPTLMRRKE